MSNWLSNRLTPSKLKEARWVEFSTVLEHVWEEYFDPGISRLERLRSAYTADDADLIKKIREMGDYFSFDRPRYEDRPVSLAWRRLELEYKDMELILSSVFRRHYSNLPVTWFPIFAPIDAPYGTLFQVAEGPWPERKNIPPEGWFLTSRGRLGTDFGHLLSIGLNKEEYMKKALPLLMRTKPLHIVLGGFLWYIYFDLSFESDLNCLWEREYYNFDLQFSVRGSRFDFTPADANPLDVQATLCTWERETLFDVIAIFSHKYTYWHLDRYLPECLSSTWLPLDTIIAGNEADGNNPCALVAVVREVTHPIKTPIEVSNYRERAIFCQGAGFEADPVQMDIVERPCPIDMPLYQPRLDHYPNFDECPADFAPLDMPIGGYAYA